jgi:sugar/nucleoside kinase (ribokinase family)
MRNGILAGGNWIIDIVKIIDSYPGQESLSNILSESKSNGGSPYNILKDLANLKAPFPLEAFGLVGEDEQGDYIISDCKSHNIATELLFQTAEKPTSYTDVMTVKSDGKRTFFHNRGANAFLSEKHIKLEQSNAKIFHLGYLLLLDALDVLDPKGMTEASKVFEKAKEMGFITVSDLVSENTDRFAKIITPSLPYLDYLFVNEFEAEKITGIQTKKEGKVLVENCKYAAKKILELGVNAWVILHFPEGCIAVSKQGEYVSQSSLKIPTEKIKSSVGAGDAFAAGVLYGIHENFSMKSNLELGVCTAAASLFDESCSKGVLPMNQTLELAKQFGFRD